MKNSLIPFLFAVLTLPMFAQGAPPQGGTNQPYTMEYYYRVQWGHQQEFLDLFLKNHYPLLKKGIESGRMVSVKIETPANHMTEDARWDYRVTIKFKNSTPPRIPTRSLSLSSFGPTRRRTNVRKAEGSRSFWRIGICP